MGVCPTLEGKWHILASPSSSVPFVHLCSEQHFPHPGPWLVLGSQRWVDSYTTPALGEPWRWDMDPPTASSHREVPWHPHMSTSLLPSPKQDSIPLRCFLAFSMLVTTGRTFHSFSTAFPTVSKLREDQDLVCVAHSHTPVPPQCPAHSRYFGSK